MFTFVLLRVLAVLLLVAANAFFVAAEYALVSVRDTRIQQLIDNRRVGARIVQKLHRRLTEVLNTVQLGVTIANLALGWLGESALARVFQLAFDRLPHAAVYSHIAATALSFMAITYLLVILGEVVPKSVALHRAERVALAVAAPMELFMTIAAPFVYIMTASSRAVLKIFGLREMRETGVHSPEELKLVVTAARRLGQIPALQEEMIHRALDIETITAREIMVPRPDIFSLPGDMTLDDALQRVVEEQHSRVPVYDPARGPEFIIGVLYAKDLMRWMRSKLVRVSDQTVRRPTAVKLQHIMRDVLVVPETKPLPDLLVEFKKRKRHLAVVVDEFGSTSGVVTVEDVLEQLVGEIEDEFDVQEQTLAPGSSSMVLDGATNIRDLETQYQITLPRDAGFETLAGFVLSRLQKIPSVGDSFEYEGRRFTVLEMDGRRVDTVRIEVLKPELVKSGD